MEELTYNYASVKTLFNITESRDTFYAKADDDNSEIPPSQKKGNGYRYWDLNSLAQIGEKYPILESPKSKEAVVISFYVSKGGGSHKTTDALNLAGYLGIKGKKVLVIGLDFQLNISKKLGIDNSTSKVKETNQFYPGIAEVLIDKQDINKAVFETPLPNVYIIPESSNLVRLEAWLVSQVRREEKITKTIEPLKKDFDAIIIDNNPSWSQLSIGSLFACDANVASIGVDSNSIEALPQFFDTLEQCEIALTENILVAGMTENNAIKKQVYGHVKKHFSDILTPRGIRKTTIVDEANALHLPVFLYKPREKVSEDYLEVCEDIWLRSVAAKDKNDNNRKIQ